MEALMATIVEQLVFSKTSDAGTTTLAVAMSDEAWAAVVDAYDKTRGEEVDPPEQLLQAALKKWMVDKWNSLMEEGHEIQLLIDNPVPYKVE
jgi:hypothetical protein